MNEKDLYDPRDFVDEDMLMRTLRQVDLVGVHKAGDKYAILLRHPYGDDQYRIHEYRLTEKEALLLARSILDVKEQTEREV
jgi:hypothetical protein